MRTSGAAITELPFILIVNYIIIITSHSLLPFAVLQQLADPPFHLLPSFILQLNDPFLQTLVVLSLVVGAIIKLSIGVLE